MDKRVLGAAFAVVSALAIGLLSGGDGGGQMAGSYRGGYYAAAGSYRGGVSTARDTSTWVWVNSFDTGTALGTHQSPFVPAVASIDSLIEDTDGSHFKYGVGYKGDPTVLNYQNNLIRHLFVSREDQYPDAAQYQPFFYWSFEDLPANVKIISAKLSYRINIGITSFSELNQFVATIDTNAADFTNYALGANRTGPDNPHYHEPAWAYADVGATAAWGRDLDDIGTSDYGFSLLGYSSVVLPPKSASTSNWFEADFTQLVQTYVSRGLSDKTIWFFGDGSGGSLFRASCGPLATDAAITQPVMVVEWTTNQAIDGVDFAVFSDNHSNTYAIDMMGAAMDGAGFSPRFLIHNGDMNVGSSGAIADSSLANQDTLSAHWKRIPIALVGGNHESSAPPLLLATIPTANKAFIDSLVAFGGSLTRLGAKDNFEMRFRNFSYDYGGVHFVQVDFENSVSGADSTTAQDIRWLESDLASSSAKVKIVFFHRPFIEENDVDYPASAPGEAHDPSPGWQALQAALENGGVNAVFSGHTHLAWAKVVNGVSYFNTPSTGNFPTQADQGFLTISIGPGGSAVVKLYRGKNSDNAYLLTQTWSF